MTSIGRSSLLAAFIASVLLWAITLGTTGAFAFWTMIVFLAVLTVGFIYEWKKGALEWE